MDDKKATPLSSDDLENVSGGIRISPKDMDCYYRCTNCGGDNFYVLGYDAGLIKTRCKRCGIEARIPDYS